MPKRFPSVSGNARILVITSGGTIVQKYDEANQGYIPKLSGKELFESLSVDIDLETIELYEYAMIDSRSVDLDFLHGLAKLVQLRIRDEAIDGIVIVHGTDTMEITAYFLHRTIDSPDKQIVITGSMRVINNHDYDGRANISNSIRQACAYESTKHAYGVSINFAGNIHSPVHVIKQHSFAVDPFTSGSLFGAIGMIRPNSIVWLNNPKESLVIPLPSRLQSVPIVYAFPGATVDCLDGYANKFKAIVIVAYGSGNVNENMYYAIKNVIESGVKVVLVTNCRYGGVYAEYGGLGGNQSLRDIGVIMADDLNPYQAMTVASLVIGNDKLPPDFPIHVYFKNSICDLDE